MDSKSESINFGKKDFAFFGSHLLARFQILPAGEIQIQNSKHCLGQIIPYLYFSDYAKLRVAPSALASGISARATSA